MLLALGLAAFAAVAVVVTTASVVILTRHESAETKKEYGEYKLTVDGRVADAKKEGIEAGKAAGDALVRAAGLEKQAAELNSANLALEEKISPRRLSQEQHNKISNALAGFAGQNVIIRSYAMDVESFVLGQQIIGALLAAKIIPLDRRMSESAGNAIALGVHVVGTNSTLVAALLKSLSEIGNLAVSPEPPPPPRISAGGSNVYGPATVFVGVKPMVAAK